MEILREEFQVPDSIALVVARILALVEPNLYDLQEGCDLGAGARHGLFWLAGDSWDLAKKKANSGVSADGLFKHLRRILPTVLASLDPLGVINTLITLGLMPLGAQAIEHMCCELHKMTGENRPEVFHPTRTSDELYRALFNAALPFYLRYWERWHALG